jgi:hypothetical protein
VLGCRFIPAYGLVIERNGAVVAEDILSGHTVGAIEVHPVTIGATYDTPSHIFWTGQLYAIILFPGDVSHAPVLTGGEPGHGVFSSFEASASTSLCCTLHRAIWSCDAKTSKCRCHSCTSHGIDAMHVIICTTKESFADLHLANPFLMLAPSTMWWNLDTAGNPVLTSWGSISAPAHQIFPASPPSSRPTFLLSAPDPSSQNLNSSHLTYSGDGLTFLKVELLAGTSNPLDRWQLGETGITVFARIRPIVDSFTNAPWKTIVEVKQRFANSVVGDPAEPAIRMQLLYDDANTATIRCSFRPNAVLFPSTGILDFSVEATLNVGSELWTTVGCRLDPTIQGVILTC